MQSSPEPVASPDEQQDGIQEIHVAGFCSIKEVDLRPGRLTVLIGPNGRGKSNLLQVLRLIPLLRTRSLQRYVADHGFGSALLHYGAKTTEAIDLGVVIKDQGRGQLRATDSAASSLGIWNCRFFHDCW